MDFIYEASLDFSLISVRDFEIQDLPYMLNYWFRSPPGFVESLGVDLNQLPTEIEMKEHLTKRLQYNSQLQSSQLNALAILYNGKSIGFHTLVPYKVGEFGIFHAHIWDPQMRRKGIGFHSYPQALKIFFERFNLQKIVFNTPAQNIGAIKVKDKLGISFIRDELIDFDIIKSGTPGKTYEITRQEAFQKWP